MAKPVKELAKIMEGLSEFLANAGFDSIELDAKWPKYWSCEIFIKAERKNGLDNEKER